MFRVEALKNITFQVFRWDIEFIRPLFGTKAVSSNRVASVCFWVSLPTPLAEIPPQHVILFMAGCCC